MWDGIRAIAPTPGEGLAWRSLLTADGDELYVNGVLRGEVRCLGDGAYEAAVQVRGAEEWQRGRHETREGAMHAVSSAGVAWLADGQRRD